MLSVAVTFAAAGLAFADDPFQSDPGPAPPAVQPRPRPVARPVPVRPGPQRFEPHQASPVVMPAPAQPEPASPAAPPAPAMASDAVRQFAASRGVPLPGDLQIHRISGGSAPANGLIGIWGGGAIGFRQLVIGVESLDAIGRAIVVHAYSDPTPSTWEHAYSGRQRGRGDQNPANWWRVAAQVQGNALSWIYSTGRSFRLTLVNQNQAFFERTDSGRNVSGYLSRLQ